MNVSLQSVAQCFDRGSDHYDELAVVQPQVANTLLQKVIPQVAAASTITDLGCGTGHLLSQCSQLNPSASLIGVDISPKMLLKASQNVNAQWLNNNLENTQISPSSQDMVLSTSAMQWGQPELAFAEASRIMRGAGMLAVSSFLRGTLATWRGIWGLESDVMLSLADFVSAANAAGLNVLEASTDRIVQVCHSFDACVASVRDLGAGGDRVQVNGLLGRDKYKNIRDQVNKTINTEGSFPMEYEVVYLLAEKKVAEKIAAEKNNSSS